MPLSSWELSIGKRAVKGAVAVKCIVPTGFTSQRLRHDAALRPAAILRCVPGIALLLLASFVCAQAGPVASSRQQRRQAAASAPAATPAQAPTPDPAPPVVAPPATPVAAPAPIQAPEHPPNVTWNGKELTVDADNSSLMEILTAVRSKTGAAVDMPGSTSNERVAVHIGPAPIRDVLATLLYGTNFDYVIQATDDGEGLRSLVLTLRGASDGDAVVASSGGGTDKSEQPGVRMMKGWSAPGKTAFQVSAEAAMADESNSDRASATKDSGSPDSATSAPDPAASGAESASTGSQGTNGTSPPDASPSSAPVGDSMSPLGAHTASTALSSTQSINGDTSTMHSMDDLQRLYEQRRQLQMQQNQAAGKPSN